MKQLKVKLPKKMEKFIEEKDVKNKLKKAGVVIAFSVTGLVCYKVGEHVGVMKCDCILGKFLNEHPDMKEPFVKAWEEFYKVKVKL